MKIKRAKSVMFFTAAAFTALLLVLLRISVFKNKEYSQSAALQRQKTVTVKHCRGMFYDRNMIPLVENHADNVNIPTGDGDKSISVPSVARYRSRAAACHIIGYTDSDGNGITGLEKCFDKVLAGNKIQKLHTVTDAGGRIVDSAGSMLTEQGTDALNIRLTIDCHIQQIAEECMRSSAINGAVVIMDVQNSDVLAMASSPGYDPNNINKYLDSANGEFLNRCISEYNAGSVFKIITLAAAIENNINFGLYDCCGKVVRDGREFACHLKTGHGMLDYANAFAKSCNCAFYDIGLCTGGEKILSMARSFGFGEKLLCFDGLEEKSGNIPVKGSCGDFETINYSIGQGEILITPVQAANMVCIIANDGVANCVNIADSIVDRSGALCRDLRETAPHRVISRQTALEIRSCMALAVQNGTASGALSDIVDIAGKTGTAQTGWYNGDDNIVHGWFCGYFPADNPRYAMAVLAENGKSGSESAVPVFKKIAEEIVKFYPVG